MSNYSTISKCRLCSRKSPKRLFSLGNQYISTFVKNPDDHIGQAPLELTYCDQCTLVQLRHTAPQELLYSGNYWYESALNKVIINDLHDIVREARKYHRKGTWIDIGANDGTLLSFVGKGFIKIGVEPAKNLTDKLANNCDLVINKFWEDYDSEMAEVITAIGMFYDSDDPNLFIANVAKHLMPDGVFIAQMMASKQMLERNDVGNICHEHLEYYSYESLKYLFENNGLEIFRVEENNINGGSYRLYARPYSIGSVSYNESITDSDYLSFAARIRQNKEKCVRFIKSEVANGKKIYGYGASTKGNTILQWYGLGPKDIRGIAEIHPEKLGKFTVGTKIPIVAEAKAKADADYLLILPYAFRESFIKKNSRFIEKGGKLIFCTPYFEIHE